jgi:predicted amidohydrolase
MSRFTIATCQFPIQARCERNSDRMASMIESAADQGARVVHFPEGALSGYAGTHFCSWDGFEWNTLQEQSERMLELARELSVWILFGSAHRLSSDHLPHNSVYVVSPAGQVVERYDKLFCTRTDLKYYTPGNHFCVFEIECIKCGVLICHDIRYPELNRTYTKEGVRCLFYSFYNAGAKGPKEHTFIMPATQQARAATNYMWLSVSNASNHYQLWSSSFVTPEGRILQKLRRHRSGLIVNTVDTEEKFADKSSYRDLAIRGILHSGTAVDDPRSQRRDTF